MLRRLSMAALICAATAVHADVVTMANGDRITGTLDSISSGGIRMETEYAGFIVIDKSKVATIETDEAFDTRVAGRLVSGRFSAEGDAQRIVSDTATTDIALGDVYSSGHDNLGLGIIGSEWSSRATLGLIISNGNSDTQNLNTLVESALKRAKVEHSVSLLVNNEESEEETTKDIIDFDYGYKRFLSEKWYASGNGEYFRDKLKDVDQRITLGAGMGYQFWDNSFGAFSSDLGLSVVREELDGEEETNPAVRWGLDYNRFFFAKRMELFHKQSVLFIPDADRGEVISTSTGLRYALNDRLDTAARVDVNHETDPPEGNSKTDVTYTIGVSLNF